MDPELRRYLEQPPPRRGLASGHHRDARIAWLLPAGAAITGGLAIGGIVGAHRDLWNYGAAAWIALVVLAYAGGRAFHAARDRMLRYGRFGTARVSSIAVDNDGDERSLAVRLEVEDETQRAADPPRAGQGALYGMALTDRWIDREGGPRFDTGATFPILMDSRNGDALVFIEDALIDARRIG